MNIDWNGSAFSLSRHSRECFFFHSSRFIDNDRLYILFYFFISLFLSHFPVKTFFFQPSSIINLKKQSKKKNKKRRVRRCECEMSWNARLNASWFCKSFDKNKQLKFSHQSYLRAIPMTVISQRIVSTMLCFCLPLARFTFWVKLIYAALFNTFVGK